MREFVKFAKSWLARFKLNLKYFAFPARGRSQARKPVTLLQLSASKCDNFPNLVGISARGEEEMNYGRALQMMTLAMGAERGHWDGTMGKIELE